MSAGSGLRPTITAIGVNVAILSDRSEVHIADIKTAAEGNSILADIDASILSIEAQLEFGRGDAEPGWRARAEASLKIKRRLRPALQQRIGELRRAEHVSGRTVVAQAYAATVDAKRKAFIDAAGELLGHEICVEIWARAQQIRPSVFDGCDQP